MERTVQVFEKKTYDLPHKKRVADSARVSLGTEHMLHSLAAQVSYYSNMIQKNPEWEFAGIFADKAQTGTKDSRPEFQRLMNDCRNGLIDMVIVKSISRLARNTVTLLNTVRELKELGIDIFFEEQNIHTMSETGEMMLSLFAVFAQEESKNISDNIKWRKQNDMKNGKTKPKAIYGYDVVDGILVINEEQAEVIREMYRLYLDGMGFHAIANYLNEKGIPSPMGTSKWRDSVVNHLMGNEKMRGNVLHQVQFTEDYLTKRQRWNRGELPMYLQIDTHEGIVSNEIFEKAKAERERRSRVGGLNEYVGLAFRKKISCPCGMHFGHNRAGKKWWVQNTWRCNGHDKRNSAVCTAKDIPEDILMKVSSEVLDLEEFDSDVFLDRVEEIFVPENYKLVFIMKDGTKVERTWQPKKRGPNKNYDGKRWD